MDLSLVPSTQVSQLTTAHKSSSRDQMLSSGPHMHTLIQMCTDTCINKSKSLNKQSLSGAEKTGQTCVSTNAGPSVLGDHQVSATAPSSKLFSYISAFFAPLVKQKVHK